MRLVERWLGESGAISHPANPCCSTGVTNSRPKCLFSVNGSLICCTMEMGRGFCVPCCSFHQRLGFTEGSAWRRSVSGVWAATNFTLQEESPGSITAVNTTRKELHCTSSLRCIYKASKLTAYSNFSILRFFSFLMFSCIWWHSSTKIINIWLHKKNLG